MGSLINKPLFSSTANRFDNNRGSILGSLNTSRVSGLGLNNSLERRDSNPFNWNGSLGSLRKNDSSL